MEMNIPGQLSINNQTTEDLCDYSSVANQFTNDKKVQIKEICDMISSNNYLKVSNGNSNMHSPINFCQDRCEFSYKPLRELKQTGDDSDVNELSTQTQFQSFIPIQDFSRTSFKNNSKEVTKLISNAQPSNFKSPLTEGSIISYPILLMEKLARKLCYNLNQDLIRLTDVNVYLESLEIIKIAMYMIKLIHKFSNQTQNEGFSSRLSTDIFTECEMTYLDQFHKPVTPTNSKQIGLILAHPDEFKNPSSFLRMYPDPRSSIAVVQKSNLIKGKFGNWGCTLCNNINYPRRNKCNKCNALRDDAGDKLVDSYAKEVYAQLVSINKELNYFENLINYS